MILIVEIGVYIYLKLYDRPSHDLRRVHQIISYIIRYNCVDFYLTRNLRRTRVNNADGQNGSFWDAFKSAIGDRFGGAHMK